VGAPEVEELTQLRDERKQLIRLIAELKAENRRLKNKLAPRTSKSINQNSADYPAS
jgi:hypothetical protein